MILLSQVLHTKPALPQLPIIVVLILFIESPRALIVLMRRKYGNSPLNKTELYIFYIERFIIVVFLLGIVLITSLILAHFFGYWEYTEYIETCIIDTDFTLYFLPALYND